jgi:DNA modification methylase
MAISCLNSACGQNWTAFNGDSCAVLPQFPDDSIDFSAYSPPFKNLFVYSWSANDLGNSANDDEFFEHYKFLIREKLRITKPGRLTAVHCSDLPTRKWKDGYIGSDPFSDNITAAHIDAGWHFVRRVTVWRDPVVEMTRTKALHLLHKQILKDSTCSWPGTPDYLLLFRKPGDNAVPVGHKPQDFPVELWQKWASPVWFDINQTDVLNNKASASRWIGDPVSLAVSAEDADERHICPLQLSLIERAVVMWSNPGEVVLSPFLGIGSEGVVSLRRRRKFIGVELKPSYWRQACRSLDAAEQNARDIFDGVPSEPPPAPAHVPPSIAYVRDDAMAEISAVMRRHGMILDGATAENMASLVRECRLASEDMDAAA